MLIPGALAVQLPRWHIRVSGGLYILSYSGRPSSRDLLLHPLEWDILLGLELLFHDQYVQLVQVRSVHFVYLKIHRNKCTSCVMPGV